MEYLNTKLNTISKNTIKSMFLLRGLAHIIIALLLGVSVFMITWLFCQEIWVAFTEHNLIHSFFHSLGSLMLLWTVSALISAEIGHLQGTELKIEGFIKVAVIVMIRKIIVLPVQDISPPIEDVFMWVGAALMLGVLFALISWSQSFSKR